MSKLVHGVGINDLPYMAQVKEWVTKNGGKRIQALSNYSKTLEQN